MKAVQKNFQDKNCVNFLTKIGFKMKNSITEFNRGASQSDAEFFRLCFEF